MLYNESSGNFKKSGGDKLFKNPDKANYSLIWLEMKSLPFSTFVRNQILIVSKTTKNFNAKSVFDVKTGSLTGDRAVTMKDRA